MKKKILIIFKYPRGNWNGPVIRKFSNFYDVEHLYISDYKNENFTEIIENINNLVKLKNIEIVVFDVDYFKFINLFFINKIDCKKKILITGDDFDQHDVHSITASACDIVLSGCPLSVLKYKEKGYESHWMHYESGNASIKSEENKDIDVLFFGHISPDRKFFLNHLVKEGINLKNVGHEDNSHGIPYEELLKLISRSKIILNLSKSRTESVKNHSMENTFRFYYQFKGRMIMAGMGGAACVSEYSPSQDLLFNKDEITTFFSKEECVTILKKILGNTELLKKYTTNFTLKVQHLCDDKNIFSEIKNSIEKKNNRKVELFKIPYWYLRISAKQILLRNIKLSNFIKTLFQLGTIFNMVKNSNYIVKILILLESIINISWYSVVSTVRSK